MTEVDVDEPDRGLELEDESRALLEGRNFAHVVTTKADGRPRVIIVWVHFDEGWVVLNGLEGRPWTEDLVRDPRIVVTVTNQASPYEYVTITGTVAERRPDGAQELYERMSMKYFGDEGKAPKLGNRIVLRIAPTNIRHYHASVNDKK